MRGFTLIELLVALFITAIVFVMGYGAIDQALKDQQSLTAQQARLTAVQNAMRVLVQDFTQLTPRPVRDEIGDNSLPCLVGSPGGVSLTGTPLGSAASGGSFGAEDASGPGGPGNLGGPSTLGGPSNLAGQGNLGGASTIGAPDSLAGPSGLDSSSGPGNSGASGNSSSAASGDSRSSGSASSSAESSDSDNAVDLVAFTRMGWANPAGVQRPAEERVSYRLENGVLERLHWPELDVTEATTPIRRDLLDHVKSVTFQYLTESHQWTDQWPPLGNIPLSPLAGNQTLRMRPIAVEVTLELDDWGTIVRIIEIPT